MRLAVSTDSSAPLTEGLWSQVPLSALIGVLLACEVLLANVLASITLLARRLGFDHSDEITIVSCGSKKSLAVNAQRYARRPMLSEPFDEPMSGKPRKPRGVPTSSVDDTR